MEKDDWRTAVRAAGTDSVCIDLYVEPGSSRQAFGPYDPWRQRVHMSVKAPALDGKANRELTKALADILGVHSNDVRILRGATTRRKTARVDGIALETAVETLSGHLGGEGEGPR